MSETAFGAAALRLALDWEVLGPKLGAKLVAVMWVAFVLALFVT